MHRIVLSSLFLILIQYRISAQNTANSQTEDTSAIPDIEKVYVHTDRSCYTIGESLWYKAYLVYAYTNVLFDHSNALYVELVSPDSKIIARNITRLENGLGHGDFKLADSLGISAGQYQLRAYTNWMRNFDDRFIFNKTIEIIDITQKEDVTPVANNNAATSNSKTTISNNITSGIKHHSIQLFPEGGSLIADVSSVVAFKATDSTGLPVAVKGRVLDAQKNEITLFKSAHDGMGKFMLTPKKGEQIYRRNSG